MTRKLLFLYNVFMNHKNKSSNNEKSKKLKRFFLIHGVVALILLFLLFVYKCPLYHFFNIPCPGCGISRAHMAALSFDFKLAFKTHPLFFTVLPIILYTAHKNLLKKALNPKLETAILICLLLLFIGVYIFRLVKGSLLF